MKKYNYLIAILLLQVLVFISINGLGVLNTDDIFTIHTTSHSNLLKVLHKAIYFEMQFPLYFILMSLWREISDALYWTKLFNYLWLSLSTVFFYKILRILIENKRDIYILLLFFALHPFLLFISNDLRRSSLTLFFAVITLYYFVRIYIQGHNNKWDHACLIFFASLGLLNDYFHAFLLTSLGAGILFSKSKIKWHYFLDMILPVTVFLILLSVITLNQVDDKENLPVVFIESNVVIAAIKHTVSLLESQTYLLDSTSQILKLILRLIFFSSLIYIFLVKRKFFSRNSELNISALSVLIICFLVVLILQSTGFLHLRYVGFSFPLIFLCFSLLLVNAFSKDNIRLAVIMVFVVLASVGYNHYITNNYSTFKEMKVLSARVGQILPQEKVFVMNGKYAEMINYYINDPGKKVNSVPGTFNFEVFDWPARTIKSEEQVRAIFENVSSEELEFHVIFRTPHLKKNLLNSQILYTYLNENFQLKSEEECGEFMILNYK